MAERTLHVYAVTDRPEASLPPVRGLGDAPLQAVPHDGLAAVCSWSEDVEATPPALWRHEAVAEALMEDRSVLPARFGVAFTSEARLRAELARRRKDLSASLRRVAGCVEIGLRVLRESGPDERRPEAGGRSYLEARLEKRRRAEQIAEELHEPLTSLASASRKRVLQTPRLVLSAAYLVERGRLEALRGEVDRLAGERPELQILCTGPWPPYSFATLDEVGR
jgi:hypothetical protein